MSLWRKRQLNIGKKMNTEDIISMAREAGLWPSVTDTFPEEVQRFATLVAAAEREECAEACESDDWNVAAAMVRARKNK
jgi:hypothetical protein